MSLFKIPLNRVIYFKDQLLENISFILWTDMEILDIRASKTTSKRQETLLEKSNSFQTDTLWCRTALPWDAFHQERGGVERAGKGHFLPSWECPNPAENLACRRRKVSSISSERMVFICMRHFPGPLEVTSSSGPASTTLRGREACLWQTGKARLIKRCDNTH